MKLAALAFGLFALAGSAGAQAQTSCQPTDRTVKLINQCNVTVLAGAVGNTAAQCQQNSDCQPNQFCTSIVNNAPQSCAGGAACPSGQTCNSTTNVCNCTASSQCPSGQFCDSTTNTCSFRLCTFVPVGGTLTVSSTSCTSNSQCSATQFCDTSTGKCATVPSDGNGWSLSAGASRTVCVPTPWAGRFWPRTGCTVNGAQANCETGQCVGTDNKTPSVSCALSGVPPATLAELNMQSFGQADFYDVSLVDGANLAVALIPTPATYDINTNGGVSATSCTSNANCSSLGFNWQCDTSLQKCVNIFQCGSPGCASGSCAASGLQASLLPTCPWAGSSSSFAVAQSSCNSATQVLNGSQAYVGCLSPDKACAASNPASLNCAANQNLYGCTGPNAGSCFSNVKCSSNNDCNVLPPGFTCQGRVCVDPNCCGCPSWAPSGTCVAGNNPTWDSVAEPFAAAFNTVCPTAYSFAFDDVIKTFTCVGKAATNNVGYSVVFCPAAKTGG